MVIAQGEVLNPLAALEAGAVATWFGAETDPQAARKSWISAMKPKGALVIDEGAAEALGQGRSLLPAGVRDVKGSFGRGEPVEILGPDLTRIGIGLARYTSEEAGVIKGQRSDRIEGLLGYPGRAALVHRDDLVL